MQSRLKEDLGADNLDAAILFMEIDEEFDIRISNEDQDKISTVQHIYEYLVKRLKIAS